VKDKNQEKQLRKHIAQEIEGQDVQTAKATLPADAGKNKGLNKTQVGTDGGVWHPGGSKKTQIGTEGGVWHPGKSLKGNKAEGTGDATGWRGPVTGKGNKTHSPKENAGNAEAIGGNVKGEAVSKKGHQKSQKTATFPNANTLTGDQTGQTTTRENHKQQKSKTQNFNQLGQGAGTGKGKGKGAKPSATPLQLNPAILSDRRMKTNISFVGWSPMGIPIYRFSYIKEPNKRYQGTIAQAVARIRPDAVIWKDGLMFVDYSRLDVQMEELPQGSKEDGSTSPSY